MAISSEHDLIVHNHLFQDNISRLHLYNLNVVKIEFGDAIHEFDSQKPTLHWAVDHFDGAVHPIFCMREI